MKKLIAVTALWIFGGFGFSLYQSMWWIAITQPNVVEYTASGSLIWTLTTSWWAAPYQYQLTWSDSSGFYIVGDKLYLWFTPVHQGFSTGKNTYTLDITSIDTSMPTFAIDVSTAFGSETWFYGNESLPNLGAIGWIKADWSLIARWYNWDGGAKWWVDGSGSMPTDSGYTQIISNYGAFAALKNDGSIVTRWADLYWGIWNSSDTGFTSISSNGESFAALKNDGSIFSRWYAPSWGTWGPSGTGFISIASNRYAYAALKDDGSIAVRWTTGRWGDNWPTGTGFVKIFGWYYAFVALKGDGSLVSRGDAARGGSGAPTGTGYTAICGNNYAFAALKDDGSISVRWTAGRGGNNGPTDTWFVKIFGAGSAFAGLKDDGSIVAWWHASYGWSGAPTGTGYTKIIGNSNSFEALNNDGSIATRGWGPYGGRGPWDTGYVNIYWTYEAFAALKYDGSVTSRGVDTYWWDWTAPTDTGYVKIVSTQNTFIWIKSDGSLTAWWSSVSDRQDPAKWNMVNNIWATYTNNIWINITNIPITGTIEYSTTATISGDVIATLTGLSEPVTITNNSGSNQYTFTDNGSFTFTLIDSDGNTGSITATVANIDKTVHNLWGWGGWISKDYCPDGDYSSSYYDGICGNKPTTVATWTNTVITQASDELISAYKWALGKQITTMSTLEVARIGDPLTRGEMAKMIVNYAINNLWKTINTGNQANFTDINGQTAEMKNYINKAYQLGLMWVNVSKFNPNSLVTRAEFATVLARLLYNTTSNQNELYYTKPLAILSEKWIIKNTNPLLQEARGYIMLMLMRASK